MAAVAGALLVACGGGTDIAPSEPYVAGDGFATVRLGALDLGSTESVVAVASLGAEELLRVTDEIVTFAADDTAQLSQAPVLDTVAVLVTSVDGLTAYLRDLDFTIDFATGILTRLPGGSIPAGGTVAVDFAYGRRQLYHLRVGISFAAGYAVQVQFFNLYQGMPVPVTITRTGGGAPADGTPAFDVEAQGYGQVASLGQHLVVGACDTSTDPVDCPVANVAVVADFDVTNVLNPCASGSVSATLSNQADADPLNRVALQVEFDDPVCD